MDLGNLISIDQFLIKIKVSLKLKMRSTSSKCFIPLPIKLRMTLVFYPGKFGFRVIVNNQSEWNNKTFTNDEYF